MLLHPYLYRFHLRKCLCMEIPSHSPSLFLFHSLSIPARAPALSIQQLKSWLEITHTLPQGTSLLFGVSYIFLHAGLVHHTGWSVIIDGDDSVARTSLTLFILRRHRFSEVPHVFYTLKVFSDFSMAVTMLATRWYMLNYRYHIYLPYW